MELQEIVLNTTQGAGYAVQSLLTHFLHHCVLQRMHAAMPTVATSLRTARQLFDTMSGWLVGLGSVGHNEAWRRPHSSTMLGVRGPMLPALPPD